MHDILKTCKAHNSWYNDLPRDLAGNKKELTSQEQENLTYGIDRLLEENPDICSSLSRKDRHRTLIYASRADKRTIVQNLIITEPPSYHKKRIKILTIMGYPKDTIENTMNAYKRKRYNAAEKSNVTAPSNSSFPDEKTIADHIRLANRIIALRNATYTPTSLSKQYDSIDATETPRSTELHRAAAQGDVRKLQQFLNEGADVDSQTIQGSTPLKIAVSYNHIDIIKLLIDYNAHVNGIDPHGSTALHTAAEGGSIETAILLMQAGANINQQNKIGETPLDIALHNGHEQLVEILLSGHFTNSP